VLSLYGDTPTTDFPADLKDKILFGGVTEKDVEILAEPTGINLAKLAASYSDGIILGAADVAPEVVEYCSNSGLPVLPFNAEKLQDGSYIEDYNSFYDNL
jgi:starch synthase